MTEQLPQYLDVLVGGLIGFLSSIGALAATRWMDRKGKLKIFCKRTNDEGFAWGFHKDDSARTLCFAVPLDIELMNTSNTTRVIRDVQMRLYRRNTEVFQMKQIDGAVITHTKGSETTTKEKTFGTKNSSYSFVLPPRSIQKQSCEYMLIPSSLANAEFDEIRISFYNEKGKLICKSLAKYNGDWAAREEEPDQDWIELK